MRRTIYETDVVWKIIKENAKKMGMKASEYIRYLALLDDEKRLLKANAITKFLVEHEKKQELIDYLKEEIKEYEEKYNNTCVFLEQDRFETRINTYREILSKIEKSDK